MRRLALYSFVITLIWLGFVGAISFMEAPLKFRAPGVEMKQAVSIGHVVFHALNRMEWISAALSWIIALRLGVLRTRGLIVLLGAVTGVLIIQTFGLYPTLDVHAVAVIKGEASTTTWHHTAFIAAEVVKVILLMILAAAQIQTFARAVISE